MSLESCNGPVGQIFNGHYRGYKDEEGKVVVEGCSNLDSETEPGKYFCLGTDGEVIGDCIFMVIPRKTKWKKDGTKVG